MRIDFDYSDQQKIELEKDYQNIVENLPNR